MDLQAILVRAPVDRLAARVTSQRRAAAADTPLTREELAYLLGRLERKQRLLKQVLGIKTKAQHKNLRYKHNRTFPQFRQRDEPRAFTEYIRVGNAMQLLIGELAALRSVRRLVAAAEKASKALQ